MMPTAELASDIIAIAKAENWPWFNENNVIENNMSPDQKNDVNDTILFLTEVTNQAGNHANDTFKSWNLTFELQIFWAVQTDTNIQETEIELMKRMEDKGWIIEQSKQHTTDPDTSQVTKTIYLTKNKPI